MKKIAVLLSALLANGLLHAGDLGIKPLIGIELGYGGTDVKRKTAPIADNTEDAAVGGLKIGAKDEEYRVFISGRMYDIDGFDMVTSFGGEFQYLIPIKKELNIFLGVNGGLMDMEFNSAEGVRIASASYFGGDAGVTFDLTESLAIELGARYMKIDEDHTLGGV